MDLNSPLTKPYVVYFCNKCNLVTLRDQLTLQFCYIYNCLMSLCPIMRMQSRILQWMQDNEIVRSWYAQIRNCQSIDFD